MSCIVLTNEAYQGSHNDPDLARCCLASGQCIPWFDRCNKESNPRIGMHNRSGAPRIEKSRKWPILKHLIRVGKSLWRCIGLRRDVSLEDHGFSSNRFASASRFVACKKSA
jgi:hypothetical protein